MADLQRVKKKEVILAFPGMGKTPYALRHPGVIDLDFGLFRTSLGVAKEKEDKLLLPFARLIKEYYKLGYTVLTNEPKLIPYIDRMHMRHSMYLPNNLSYSAQKLGVAKDAARKWVGDWAELAWHYNVPLKWIDVGLDSYLS